MRAKPLGMGLVAVLSLLPFMQSRAVPSFARQTGMDCTTCHMSWLELTNVGRRFKMGGYLLMKQMDDDVQRPLVTFRFDTPPPLIPLAAALQLGVTSTKNTNTPGTFTNNTPTAKNPFGVATNFPSQNEFVLQQASIFLNGRIYDHLGCFCQFTYNSQAGTTTIDNFELRAADSRTFSLGPIKRFELIYGLALNDSPGMSDTWNTTPVFSWPYISSQVNVGPIASPIINQSLAESAAGLTAYTFIDHALYLEAGAYHQTDGALSFFHLNIPLNQRYGIDGWAPYYRAALNHDWDRGHQSLEVGTFGLQPKVWQPTGTNPTIQPSGPTDNYVDKGYDAQYQYIYDKHRVSVMFTLEDETQHLGETYGVNGGAQNDVNHVSFINTKISYYYRKWYGVTVGYQKTTGSPDNVLYGPYDAGHPLNPAVNAVVGSASGSPDTQVYIGELDYLFSLSGAQDHRKSRVILQYWHYTEFNGASGNYNAAGRNASDNDFWWLGLWLLY